MSGGWRSGLRRSSAACLAVAGLAAVGPPVVVGAPTATLVSAERDVPLAMTARLLVAPAPGERASAAALPPAAEVTGAAAAAPLPTVDLQRLPADGIPPLVLTAYRAAADREATAAPRCGLTWPLLAAIGRVESDHGRDVARGGGITADGTVLPPIVGPVLDGSAGTAAIADPAAGAGAWARAVGPMQFLTSTWALVGVDGNGDGRADPSNVFDASLAAARYLCAGGRSLADPAGLAAAVYSYNHSDAYVSLVLALANGYATSDPAGLGRGVPLPALTAPPATAPAGPPRTPAPTTSPPSSPRPRPGPTSPPPTSPAPTSPPGPQPVVQVITFAGPAVLSWPGPAAALSATGGGSGQPVTFTAGPAQVCRTARGRLVPTGAGTCSVTAQQAGAPGYLPAAQVIRSVPVAYAVVVVSDLGTPAPVGPPLPVALTLPGARPGQRPAVTATAVDGQAVPAPAGAFSLDPDGTYRWSVPTRGLAPGPHTLAVTVAGDPTAHQLLFQLR